VKIRLRLQYWKLSGVEFGSLHYFMCLALTGDIIVEFKQKVVAMLVINSYLY
jgi:hypothetical protein